MFWNAVSPVVTRLGLSLPALFSGAVFVEGIFAWPGVGRVLIEAVVAPVFALFSGVAPPRARRVRVSGLRGCRAGSRRKRDAGRLGQPAGRSTGVLGRSPGAPWLESRSGWE